MAVLHNGLQLSRNIGKTLFRAIDNDLASAGLTVQQTNSEGETNEVSIGTFASNFLQSFANRLFSAENVAELSLTFKKLNWIYQTSANIVSTVASIGNLTQELTTTALETYWKDWKRSIRVWHSRRGELPGYGRLPPPPEQSAKAIAS